MKEWTLWSDRVERIPLQTRPPVRTSIKTHVCVAFQRASPPSNLLIECYITHLDKKSASQSSDRQITGQLTVRMSSSQCSKVLYPVILIANSIFDH